MKSILLIISLILLATACDAAKPAAEAEYSAFKPASLDAAPQDEAPAQPAPQARPAPKAEVSAALAPVAQAAPPAAPSVAPSAAPEAGPAPGEAPTQQQARREHIKPLGLQSAPDSPLNSALQRKMIQRTRHPISRIDHLQTRFMRNGKIDAKAMRRMQEPQTVERPQP